MGQSAYRSMCEFRMREVLGSCLFAIRACVHVFSPHLDEVARASVGAGNCVVTGCLLAEESILSTTYVGQSTQSRLLLYGC